MLIGRSRELELWRTTLGALDTHAGAVMLVLGEAGIGKSHLLEAFTRIARERGLDTRSGRCFRDAGQRAFSPWRQALGQSAGVFAPEHVALDARDARMRTFEAALAATLDVARRQPLLVTFEDLHWADRDSLELLLHAVRFGLHEPLFLLGSVRTPDLDGAHNQALDELLSELAREPRFRRIDVNEFSASEVGQYAAQLAGGNAPQALTQAIWQETRGNALYVRELTRHLVESGKIVVRAGQIATDYSVAELAPPPSIRDVVRHRVARLSPAASALVRCTATCSGATALAVLAAGAELDSDAALDAVDEASAAGLLHALDAGYELSHAVVRKAVYEELNLERRSRLHRRVAEALAAEAAPNHAQIAAHYLASRSLAGAQAGVAHALHAAAAARTSAAYAHAAEFFEMALALLPEPELPERLDVMWQLAVARAQALDHERALATASSLCALLVQQGEQQRIAAVYATVARELAVGGVVRNVWEPLVAQGLAHLGERRDLDWARLCLLANKPIPALEGPVFVSYLRAFDSAAVAILREQGGELDYAATVESHNRRTLEETHALIARARSWREPAAQVRVLDACCRDLFFRGDDFPACVAHAMELLAIAERHGLLLGQLGAWTVIGCSQVVIGEIEQGLFALTRCRELARHIGSMHRLNVVGPHAVQAVLGYLQGHDISAVQSPLLDFVTSPRAAATPFGLVALNVGLLAAGVSGDVAAVERWMPLQLKLLEAGEANWNEWGAGRDCGVSALWALGQSRYAQRYLGLTQPHADKVGCACWSSAEHSAARLHALLGDPDAAQRSFERARARFVATGRRACLALCDYDEALALERAGRASDPRFSELVSAAESGFGAYRMPVWRQRASELRARASAVATPGPVQAPDGLSERELEVLRCLAQGLANKAIAAKLYISVPTVERHVANIYAKTGARGRAAATAYALKRGLVS